MHNPQIYANMRDTQFRKAAKVTEKDELHELFLIGNTHLETLGSAPPRICCII